MRPPRWLPNLTYFWLRKAPMDNPYHSGKLRMFRNKVLYILPPPLLMTSAWYPKTLYPLGFLQSWAHVDPKGSKNIYSLQGTRT